MFTSETGPAPNRRSSLAPGSNLLARKRRERVFAALCLAATCVGVLLLVVLLFGVIRDGAGRLSWEFLQSFPSRFARRAGIKAALFGTLWVIGITALFAIPVGVLAAIYLEEYARKNRLTAFIQTNIANLAGVPSVIYGLLGLAVFVRSLALGRSVLAGALTMALLILPTVIIATQEALRAVPNSLREASFGLGATRWQTIRLQVVPAAFGGIMTGVILSLSRAIGETAPLITIGALTFVAFVPRGPRDSFTALPIQIFNWASRPQQAFHENAAAGILVLLAVLLVMNSLAVFLRQRHQRRLHG
jgi:phosphate transport system permease protein